jgi:hypothetical protein
MRQCNYPIEMKTPPRDGLPHEGGGDIRFVSNRCGKNRAKVLRVEQRL